MRRYLAPVLAALSLASVPALALADAPAAMHDCAQRCDCTTHDSAQPKAKSAASQQEQDFLNSIWTQS